jgi:thioesterase domain-containing protein
MVETHAAGSTSTFVTPSQHYLLEPRPGSLVVPLRPFGSRPPFIWVRAVAKLRGILRRLGPDQPSYALITQGQRLPAPYTFEELARLYVEDIRELQPQGPYYLAGWCSAGVLAFEIAQQLHARGEKVALLAVFDVPVLPAGRQPEGSSLRRWAGRIEQQAHALRALDSPARMKYLWDGLASFHRYHVATPLWQLLSRRAGPAASALAQDPELAFRLASYAYSPRPFPGVVTLFQSSGRPRAEILEVRTYWQQWAAGGLEAHEVPGDHESMFDEPQAETTARTLCACLERAQSSGTVYV